MENSDAEYSAATHCYASLVDRLRGVYTVPVNDGAGPLNGKDTFTRTFYGLPPIQGQAADAIVELLTMLKRFADCGEQLWDEENFRDGYKKISSGATGFIPWTQGLSRSASTLLFSVGMRERKKNAVVLTAMEAQTQEIDRLVNLFKL